jgi:hypothetical protein
VTRCEARGEDAAEKIVAVASDFCPRSVYGLVTTVTRSGAGVMRSEANGSTLWACTFSSTAFRGPSGERSRRPLLAAVAVAPTVARANKMLLAHIAGDMTGLLVSSVLAVIGDEMAGGLFAKPLLAHSIGVATGLFAASVLPPTVRGEPIRPRTGPTAASARLLRLPPLGAGATTAPC